MEYAAAHPIPFGDDVACWLWGHGLHEDVNGRTGKPGLTLDEFKVRYAKPA